MYEQIDIYLTISLLCVQIDYQDGVSKDRSRAEELLQDVRGGASLGPRLQLTLLRGHCVWGRGEVEQHHQ